MFFCAKVGHYDCDKTLAKMFSFEGHLGGSVVEHLPLAQAVSWDPGIESHIRLPAGSLLLLLPVSLSLSLCVFIS